MPKLQVKVKHLIEALQKYDPELPVGLDKDGWMEDEMEATDEVDLIKKRGLWSSWNLSTGKVLIINN
jgi:hypothetical protein